MPAEQLPENNVQALQAELKKLRAELLNAEIKAEAYDELINVAEAKFGIQIRKKLAPSSKQPARKEPQTI